jgi:hypothetical protein
MGDPYNPFQRFRPAQRSAQLGLAFDPKGDERRRQPISDELRFEILKRDGYRCVYCGATAPTRLEIDHITAVSRGGTNAPTNLVTACRACNSGKSNVMLDETQLASAADAVEDTKHMRAHVEATLAMERAQNELRRSVCEYWREHVGEDMPDILVRNVHLSVGDIGIDRVLEAVRETGRNRHHVENATKYFRGILKRRRRELGVPDQNGNT